MLRIVLYVVGRVYPKCNNWFTTFASVIITRIHLNGYIALINGNFVRLLCGSFLNLGVLNFESQGETFSSLLSIAMIISLILYIGWSIYYLERAHSDLHSRENKKLLGELFEGLHIERGEDGSRPYLYYQAVMIRRLIFTIIIFVLEEYPIIQYNLILFYLGFYVRRSQIINHEFFSFLCIWYA